MSRLPVNLLTTCPVDAPGSMLRYADILERALRLHAPEISARRLDLAPRQEELDRWPGFLRNRLHHVLVDSRLRRLMRDSPSGLFHILDGSHAYLIRHLPAQRTLITCHDLIPLRMAMGELGRRPALPARMIIQRSRDALAAAAAVMAVSSFSARDAQERAGVDPARLSVLPNPLDEGWLARLISPRSPRRLPDAYLLHIGHDAAYKNRAAVLDIFRRIAPRWPGRLCLAGSPCPASMHLEIARSGLAGRVDFIPAPDEKQLEALYTGASLFLFPSLIEGFGWPPLEALACGCPVVASDVGGLRDVLGDSYPFLFPPNAVDAMSQGALRLLEDAVLAEDAVSRGRARVATCTSARLASGLAATYLGLGAA